jgi:signal transduction histidine kinase
MAHISDSNTLKTYLNRELMKRSSTAALGLVVLSLVSMLFTRYREMASAYDSIFVALIFVTSVGRSVCARFYLSSSRHETSTLFELHGALIVFGAATWSLWITRLGLDIGTHHEAMSLTLIIVAGIAASSILSLGSNTKLFRGFNLALFSWIPILAILKPDDYVFAVAVTSVIYFFYLNRIFSQVSKSLILQFQATLKAEETLLLISKILNNLPGLVSMVDSEFRYVFMADRLKRALNMESFVDAGLKPLGYGNEAGEFVDFVKEFGRSSLRRDQRVMKLNFQGEERTYEISLSKLDLDDSIIIFSSDIHDRVLLNLQEQRHRSDLAIASRLSAVGEMSAGIAHEINNPLAVISGRATLLKKKVGQLEGIGVADKETLLQGIENIGVMGERISKIVRGLKTFSRNESDMLIESVAVKDIVDDILGFSSERIKFLGIDLRLNFSAQDRVLANRVALSQVVLNLMNNSIDAISSQKDSWIEISTRTNEGSLEILVTDSGTGIPKEIQDRLMEPFFTTKAVGKGTGLGLSVSRGLVQGMNGSLTLDKSSANTRFVVSLKASA